MTSPLRHRVEIFDCVETPDEGGGYGRTWNSVDTIWAEVTATGTKLEKTGDREKHLAQYSIVIRWRLGISTKMQLKYAGKILRIISIQTDREEKKFLLLTTEEL